MIKTGITGGIGSGKSLVCKIFDKLGVPVYQADERAKKLMNDQPEIRHKLTERFGGQVYHNNELNRSYLAGIIFNNTEAITFVNNLVHPIVRSDFNTWCNQYQHCHYVIQEAALLFESGGYKSMDIMITVTAPEVLRIQRVQKRDSLTANQVISRIRNQMPEYEKIEKSDYIIHNDEQQSVLEQVLSIHLKIQSKL